LGLGLSLTAGNVIIGTSVANRARTLALLNVAWSIGAIASPALVRVCAPQSPRLFFLLTAVLLALAGVFATTIPHPAANAARTSRHPTRIPLPAFGIVVFATSLLLYIGNENALGGWLPSFAIRNNPAIASSTVAFAYWLSELFSRLLMAALISLITERALYLISLLILLLTQAALLCAAHPAPALIFTAAILTGAALGPLYPLIVSFLLSRTGQHARLGSLFALASLGGATLPWLTGVVSTRFGGLRPGLLVPAAGTLFLLALSPAIIPRPNGNSTN
jgi:fucose permease